MSRKLSRVLDEIQKTEKKIEEWRDHLRELNILREQLENQEIIKSIRSLKLDSRRMLEVLEGMQNGTIPLESIVDNKHCEDAMTSRNTNLLATAGHKQVPDHEVPESEEYNEET